MKAWDVTSEQLGQMAAVSDFKFKVIIGTQDPQGLFIGLEAHDTSIGEILSAIGSAAAALALQQDIPQHIAGIVLIDGFSSQYEGERNV